MKRALAILLAALLLVGLVSCGKSDEKSTVATGSTDVAATTGDEPATGETQTDGTQSADADTAAPVEREEGTLVIANEDMNQVFSPFFSTTVPDRTVHELVTAAPLVEFDKNALPTNNGLGESDWDHPEERQVDGKTNYVYKVKLKDNVKTSDGKPLTVDDVIFCFKVYLDPTYDGASTIYTTPIKGALNYKYDSASYEEDLKQIADELAAYEPTDEEIQTKAKALFEEYSAKGYEVKEEDFLKGGEEFEGETLAKLKEDKDTELKLAYINKNLDDGVDYPEIEGLVKIDDYNMEIILDELNPKAIYNLGIPVVSQEYYGVDFSKGHLEGVKSRDKEPHGAGPYVYKGFNNNVVSFEANPHYFKGEPKVKHIKIQVIDRKNAINAVSRQDADIADGDASPDTLKEIEKHENIHNELIDNNGYGYIGMNAELVPDKLVRQGIFHLLDRTPAVQAYYGDLASVIERPISQVSWAYPQDATEYYGFSPEKALEKFKEAGYEQVDGKLVKDGKQLVLNVAYPGGETDNHPVKPVFSTLKTEGEKLGMEVNLQNMDGASFFSALQSGQLAMWAAAWQAVPDPDMTQIYRSDGPTNHYKIKSAELDKLIDEGLKVLDQEKRKEIYAKALDLVMEEAVEMPFYQRKNLVMFNSNVVDIDSLPEEMTPYWGYNAEIENLQLVK